MTLLSENGILYNKDKTKLIELPENNATTEFSVPNTITSLDDYVCNECLNLTKVTIPNSVVRITTFIDCPNVLMYDLTSYNDPNNIPTIYWGTFSGINDNCEILIKNNEMLQAFTNAEYWSELSNHFEIKGY